MPYQSVTDVPKYVPKKKRKQWLEVFNSAYKKAKSDGLSDKDAEAQAFAEANGVAKKEEKSQCAVIERRFLRGSQIRAKSGDKPGIEGYAAVFNQEFNAGWFVETIKPGAFTRALVEDQDVRCLFNHNPDNLLGRSKSKTLRMSEDGTGLRFDCDTAADTRVASDVQVMVNRGDIDGCSFGFVVRKCSWREETDDEGHTMQYRDIEDVDLFDVGPVTYPAYEGTSVSARALWPQGVPEEIRSHIPGLANSLLRYVSYVGGHKNSEGEAAPWVVKDHKTGKIISSHKTRKEAKKALMEMHAHEENSLRSMDPDGDGDDDEPLINALENLAEDASGFLQNVSAALSEVKNGDKKDGPKALKTALQDAKELGRLLKEFAPLAQEQLDQEDAEPRSLRAKDDEDEDGDECACECASCRDGNCEDCVGCDDDNCEGDDCGAERMRMKMRLRLAQAS